MTWQQKSDLIRKDPVTCFRHFEHMAQLFIKDLLKSNLMPVGEIVDFYYRLFYNFFIFNFFFINLQYYLQYTQLTIGSLRIDDVCTTVPLDCVR